MNYLTLTLAFAGLTVSAALTPLGRAGVECGVCDPVPGPMYGGIVQTLRTDPGKCTTFQKGHGWSTGSCRNLHCNVCMYFT